MSTQVETPRCPDAIVVVPGVGGTELSDKSGDLVWGFGGRPLVEGLITGKLFERLGIDRDLTPGGLLRVPTWLPCLGRNDPYQRLGEALRGLANDPCAVLEFGYDWRMPVSNGAVRLGVAASEHLDWWRRHPKGSREAMLSLVCHSMGGLLAQRWMELGGGASSVRQLVTLGTPFGGSVKALRLLYDGRVLIGGLRSRELSRLTRDLPGIYDLLPRYPTVIDGDTVRRPTEDDLVGAGAERNLLREANARYQELAAVIDGAEASACPITPLVGVSQPTPQSFRVEDGRVEVFEHVENKDWGGDGTVYFGAAYPPGLDPRPLPQQHGALANTHEAIEFVKHVLLARALGPPQGEGVGIGVPEAVTVGEPIQVRITGEAAAGASCRYEEVGGGSGGSIAVRPHGGQHLATATISRPGLYTIAVAGGGFSPVSVEVLVVPAEG